MAIETPSTPDHYILPDLVGHCKFPLLVHPESDRVTIETINWVDTNCPQLTDRQRHLLHTVEAGELAAYCYNTTSYDRLRICSDFCMYLFILDDLSDGLLNEDTETLADSVMNSLEFTEFYRPTKGQPAVELNCAKLSRDFWARCIKDAKPGVQARFKEAMQFLFEAFNIQAKARDSHVVPDLESYIELRRDTSGCKTCWVLIEYALDIELPEHVINHPTIRLLEQYANDLVAWSNDIFSYNVEQSRGDTHNMVVILMKYHGKTLQGAVDHIGQMCHDTIDNFAKLKNELPSWGEEVDEMARLYVQGLQDWIVGTLHWTFDSTRYFGDTGREVKETRYIKLLPLREGVTRWA
ncbi:Alpha-muurolene synthase [Paramarasmius palmivorus]|uniref:Terpene synthase n=1 Tax=Paramarasmius palmivorus TaxID=297713 RepID=A0AAW0DFD9_9AGAR